MALPFYSALGVGGFGAVFKRMHGQPTRAVKLFRRPEDRDAERRMYNYIQALPHQEGHILLYIGTHDVPCPNPQNLPANQLNIPHLHGHPHPNPNAPMIMGMLFEYYPLGSIYDVIKKRQPVITEHAALTWLHNIASALEFLARHGVMHFDLKLPNLLLRGVDFHLVLGDFGVAVHEQHMPHQLQWAVGTETYAAPEVLMVQAVTPKADVYSLGVCIWEISAGSHPYDNPWYTWFLEQTPGARAQFIINAVNDVNWPPALPIFVNRPVFTPEFDAALSRMLQVNPLQRISAAQLLQLQVVRDAITQPLHLQLGLNGADALALDRATEQLRVDNIAFAARELGLTTNLQQSRGENAQLTANVATLQQQKAAATTRVGVVETDLAQVRGDLARIAGELQTAQQLAAQQRTISDRLQREFDDSKRQAQQLTTARDTAVQALANVVPDVQIAALTARLQQSQNAEVDSATRAGVLAQRFADSEAARLKADAELQALRQTLEQERVARAAAAGDDKLQQMAQAAVRAEADTVLTQLRQLLNEPPAPSVSRKRSHLQSSVANADNDDVTASAASQGLQGMHLHTADVPASSASAAGDVKAADAPGDEFADPVGGYETADATLLQVATEEEMAAAIPKEAVGARPLGQNAGFGFGSAGNTPMV